MYKITSVLQQTSFGNMFGDAFKKFGWIGSQLLDDWFECAFQRQTLPSGEIKRDGAGSPGTYGGVHLTESERKHDPCNWCGNLARYLCPPRTLESVGRDETGGDSETQFRPFQSFHVDLSESEMTARNASGVPTEGVAAGEEVSSLRSEMAALREEFAHSQGGFAGALAARDATIASLEATTRDLQASLAAISELQEKVNSMTTASRKPRQRTKKADKPAE
jgi:hypothetical protein